MAEPEQNDFDEDFMQALAAWRERQHLEEDDAVLLLIELFKIHQSHWDELRRREIPSFDQFRSDMAKLAEAARIFQQEAAALFEVLRSQAPVQRPAKISRSAAMFAALAALAAGYLLGRVFT
jgi:hypothetical protein